MDGQAVVRLELDRSAVRATGCLRLFAAVITLTGSIWLASLGIPPWVWGIVAAGILVSVFWVVSFVAAQRRLASAERHYLTLGPEGISLGSGADVHRHGWDAIDAVEVDEDRLVLRVTLADEDPLTIEPRFGGLGVYELYEAVSRARPSTEVQTGDEVRTIGAPGHD